MAAVGDEDDERLLADPSTHMAIDGTGWVRQPMDGERLTETGQIFRMGS